MSERRPSNSEVARTFIHKYFATRREMVASGIASSATALILERTKVSAPVKSALIFASNIVAYQATLLLRNTNHR